MIVTVDLANPQAAYLQIVDAVRKAIAVGSLQAGDRLPPIRETAIQTRVNRNTVSRAYLELAHRGLVRARQGSGFYVMDDGQNRERSVRQKALQTQVQELVVEARLSRTSTDELIQMVRECAAALDRSEHSRPNAEDEHE